MLTASACETIKDIPALVAFTNEVVGEAGTPSAVLDALQTFGHFPAFLGAEEMVERVCDDD